MTQIKKGQIYRNKRTGKQLLILSTAPGGRWKCTWLTDRTGVYKESHTFLPFIIRQKFELLS